MATTVCDMPWDIIINILSRLPVKSLMRFRCVCKSWLSLCTDPKFINEHLNQSRAKNKGYVLIKHEISGVDNFSLLCDKTFVNLTRLETPFRSSTGVFIVEGYCNGLLCLSCPKYEYNMYRWNRDIYLWNPAIRKFKVLPYSLSPGQYPAPINLAFGFVPQINDYRVVRFLYRRDGYVPGIHCRSGRKPKVPPKVEMYSLRTNSWKEIQNVVPCVIYCSPKYPIVNGVVHWLARMDKEESGYYELESRYYKFILTFDMANEVFREIKLPECLRDDLVLDMSVTVESLSLFVYSKEKSRLEIWVMKESGAAESWTKQFTFDRRTNFTFPLLGYAKNGEGVLKYDDGNLVSYDPTVQQVKDLQIHGVRGSLNAFTYYIESLVLLDEGN